MTIKSCNLFGLSVTSTRYLFSFLSSLSCIRTLFPDKIRDDDDRRIGGTITTILETLGILTGILIPVLIIDELGQDLGYPIQAIIIATIAFCVFLLMIPGVREGPEIRERRTRLNEEKSESFFKGMKSALKNKNFIGYMSLYVAYTSAMGLVMGSLPFFVEDILQMPKIGEIILIFYIVFVIAAAPFWYKLSYRLGIKKNTVIGICILGCMGLPFLLIPIGPSGLPLTITILIIAGCADGAVISMTMPLFSSVIDEASLKSGKRQEGIYQGTHLFFSRLGIAYQSMVYWIIQTFTGYKSGTTDPAELMGLKIQIGFFPFLVALLGIILFWKLYTISSEQIKINALKLKELDL